MPRVLGGSQGSVRVLVGKITLYADSKGPVKVCELKGPGRWEGKGKRVCMSRGVRVQTPSPKACWHIPRPVLRRASRETSLIRKCARIGPYHRPMP